MILSDLFEATSEIPIASGVINPATGRVWLPSELRAAQAQNDAEQIRQAKQAAAAQVARDEMDNPPAAPAVSVPPTATSSTAPAPSSVTYSGALAPKKKITPDFTKAGFSSYKLPGTPTVPTVPNMTQAPAKPAAPKAAPTPVQEPIKIGGQALNPKDPADAKIIAKVQQQTQSAAPVATVDTGMQDIINRITGQIRSIKNRDDLKKVKQNIDREFTRKGVVTESAFAKRDILVKRANAKLARVLK